MTTMVLRPGPNYFKSLCDIGKSLGEPFTTGPTHAEEATSASLASSRYSLHPADCKKSVRSGDRNLVKARTPQATPLMGLCTPIKDFACAADSSLLGLIRARRFSQT